MIARVTSKGQITLPKLIRDMFVIKKGDSLEFRVSEDRIEMFPLGTSGDLYGSVKVKGRQNFKRIREAVKKEVAKRVASEGK
jgi:AbrB family looped-hinge helix DNA binding protein